MLVAPETASFFLFGPRGTGKTSWVQSRFPDALLFDLLESKVYLDLMADPQTLGRRIPASHRGPVIIDEIQKVPSLLDEIHRLIETRKLRFILTGSSARKLRRKGVNLLAGRARMRAMHPLTAEELGGAFDLTHSLRFGQLPVVQVERAPRAAWDYLNSFVRTYLREEVQQEGLTRNLAAFRRFLEAASFSQASVLNISAVARDCQVERKVVQEYFAILEDLLIACRIAPFTRRARRKIVAHPKFFLFDAGVYRALRPKGPLDSEQEIDGAAFETLLLQELRAHNDARTLGYDFHYWRTQAGLEVDLVLYGERGLHAFEIQRSSRIRPSDFHSLRAFLEDYPAAQARLVYGGERRYHEERIEVIPMETCLLELSRIL